MTTAELLAFNGKVIEEFRANGGRCGGPFEGNPMLLLTMTGAKSGRSLTTPLTYHADADRWVVMASAGGSPTDPAWLHNLRAEPRVQIEVGDATYDVIAEEVSGEERQRLFDGMAAAMPRFGEYQTKTERTIPLIVFLRA
jgi:deazaflavin-dependent oxidoreductase (nitroreductase family)